MMTLFDEFTLGNITLSNRFVRSATWEGMCDDRGVPTEKLASLYEELAKGGVGLIITGYAYVREDGKGNPFQMGLYDDALVPHLKELVSRVHALGGKIVAQIVHAGGQGKESVSGMRTIAPSAISFPSYPEVPGEMTGKDIEDVIGAFGEAAVRSVRCGFDGVQIHGAHGFLISQFLSPLTNKRKDEFGGSLENRSRFLMEVLRRVREGVGKDFPVLIKINADDFLTGGFSFGDLIRLAKMLEDEGLDGMEVSGGTPASGDRNPARIGILGIEEEAYHREYASILKSQVRFPIILVGGLRSPALLEEILLSGDADLFSLSRPFIREPGLVSRWSSGDLTKAKCISCNGCFLPGMQEGGIYCIVEKREREA
ncbi:MAG: NADH:flavin oxidoreductase [Deltaproteobacteria bacterium]|nr:NADH:flavin oxidoreductase [Deltaproteobacteria bacterium]NIS77701.1 NADH:flavin oxidoreductase [Deltaproteobacteria bacterium]